MARCLVIALLLVGCSAPQPFIAGEKVAPPYGWIDFCKRYPQDKDCND